MNQTKILQQVHNANMTIEHNLPHAKCDYRYPFGATDIILDMSEREGGTWGSIEQLSLYAIEQCRQLGYLPWLVVYYKFDITACPEENGMHSFYVCCHDLRKI